MIFRDRVEAGQMLGKTLEHYRNNNAVVYALPRGGVVLGVEIARYLNAPLDLVIPRKIGHPDYPEYAVCAVTEDGFLVCEQEAVAGVDRDWLREAIQREAEEAKRRRLVYMKGRSAVDVQGKTAIIVDDGVATGLSMIAAIQEVEQRRPAKIVVATPVIPADAAGRLKDRVDEIVALEIPEVFAGSVGAYYQKFDQVSDEEVVAMLSAEDVRRS